MGLAVLAAFWVAGAAPTFSHDVAPVLYRQCAACHRPGGVAPFSLLTYADAAKRARLIATVSAKRYMPPWLPAAPRFSHERKLTDAEIAMLARWAAAGAPEGNRAETPAPPQFAEGWQLGKPDLEAEMRASFDVPADGPDLYQCFALPAAIEREQWVRAIDIRPGNPKVVHHALLFEDISGTARRRDSGGGYPCFGTPGFLPARGLGGWTPGAVPFQTPDGAPELLNAHADLVLQVHYHPSGKPEVDRTRIALYFTDQKPRLHLTDIPLDSNRIDIPAGGRGVQGDGSLHPAGGRAGLRHQPARALRLQGHAGICGAAGRHAAHPDPHPRLEFRLAAAIHLCAAPAAAGGDGSW